MKQISEILDKNTDEIIAVSVVIPGMTGLLYLTVMNIIPPEIILVPISMILGHFFTKVKS